MRSRIRSSLVTTVIAVLVAAAPAGAQSVSAQAYAAGLAAYVHGYPPLLSAMSQANFPVNRLVSVDATSSPAQTFVVLPNVDTAYSVAKLDLRAGPRIVHVPAMPGRYYSLQLMDAYTNVVGYVASRLHDGAGDYAIVGPQWHGAVPGVAGTLHSPTNDALMLGRTLVRGPDDLAAVGALLGQLTLRGMTDVAPPPAIVLPAPPTRQPPTLPTGLAFFDAIDALLAADPPDAAEQHALKPLRRFGIGADLVTSTAAQPEAVRSALVRAANAGPSYIDALAKKRRRHAIRGWAPLDPHVGDAGSDYDLRAVIARIGLWANTPQEATYLNATVDDRGRPLNGAHRYALTFATPPPARAFWSLTMYGQDLHLYANALNRYAIGDRTPGLVHGRRGALTLWLSHRQPAAGQANWLPAPVGRFVVTLRLYVPSAAAATGHWIPPGITCVDCRP
jgi:hypothetical protein